MKKIATITWDELKNNMKSLGIVAPVPLAMIDCFEESKLKFYGYGSRFNGLDCKSTSDWDMLVVCTNEEFDQLKQNVGDKLGLQHFCEWRCENRDGIKQPIFGNYKPNFGGKNSINVRKIDDPETDLYTKTKPSTRSNYTEIIHSGIGSSSL